MNVLTVFRLTQVGGKPRIRRLKTQMSLLQALTPPHLSWRVAGAQYGIDTSIHAACLSQNGLLGTTVDDSFMISIALFDLSGSRFEIEMQGLSSKGE